MVEIMGAGPAVGGSEVETDAGAGSEAVTGVEVRAMSGAADKTVGEGGSVDVDAKEFASAGEGVTSIAATLESGDGTAVLFAEAEGDFVEVIGKTGKDVFDGAVSGVGTGETDKEEVEAME